MRILAIYRHYYPDTTPYARLLRRILEHLVRDGHSATVIAAQPTYNDVRQQKQPAFETLGGVRVYRLGLMPERKSWKLIRAANYVWFLFLTFVRVLIHRDFDLIMANCHPPVLMGMTLRWIYRFTGIPYLFHCQDIHPESAMMSGHIKSRWLANWLLAQDQNSCNSARCIVTLSEDMRRTIQDRPGTKRVDDKVILLNNFPLDLYRTAPDMSLPSIFQRVDNHRDSPTQFRIMFAGNMGPFQALERLVASAELLADERSIQFIFMGAGTAQSALKRQAASLVDRTIFFLPHQSVEVAFACMQRANLGVVSLKPGMSRVAYPSKTMTYLAAGLPLLALVDSDSEVAQHVQQSEFGYVPRLLDPVSIAETIRMAVGERSRWSPEARNALIERALVRFGSEAALERWSCLIRALDQWGASWRGNADNTAPPRFTQAA